MYTGESRLVDVVEHQIGGHTYAQLAHIIQAQQLGTVAAAPAQHLFQRGRIRAVDGAVNQPCHVQFLQHRAGFGRGGAIHAQGDGHTGFLHGDGRGDAAAKTAVRGGAMSDAGASAGEAVDDVVVAVHQMGIPDVVAQPTAISGVVYGALAVLLQRGNFVKANFKQVRMHA